MSRLLIACFGSYGDLHPYIALGTTLAARGHSVVLATSGDYEGAVERAGLEFVEVPPRIDSLGDREHLNQRYFDPRHGTRLLLQEAVYPFLEAAHAQLLSAARDVDLIVGHPLTFTVPIVAQQLHLPWLSTVLAPMNFLSRHDPPHLPMNVLRGARALGSWAYDWMFSLVRQEVWRWEAPLRAFRARQGLETRQVLVFEGVASPHGTLALFDSVLAAPQPDWPPNTHVCGAALHDTNDGRGDLAGLSRFLAEGEPPLVFALGSAAVWMGGDYFRAAIQAAGQLGRRALLLTGQPWTGPLPSTIRAFDYLPYSKVFPAACAVVHQAGAGTLAQALRSGRPQLITPVGFDQLDNAKRAAKLGLARVLPFQKVTAGRLCRHLEPLLRDPRIKQSATHIAAQLDTQGALRAALAIEGVLSAHSSAPGLRPSS